MTDKQPAQFFDWATELSDAQGHVTLSEQEAHEIGARLRRLHAENEALRKAHVRGPAEIEHVAGDVSKNGPESNMSQQPAPSAAVASKAVLAAIRAANMQLVRTGDDEFMLVTYKNARAQCDGGKCGIGGYCDDCPTPQADRQPAKVELFNPLEGGNLETELQMAAVINLRDSQPAPVEVADAIADSQYLAGVSAGWNAANADDPNAALQKLHESRAGYLKPLHAARAPADSVTAPAGWKLVPVEPTQEMIDAMRSSVWLPACYRAMLAAAPTSAEGVEHG